MGRSLDSLGTRRTMDVNGQQFAYFSLQAAEEAGAGPVIRMPRSLKVLYENLLRHEDGKAVRKDHLLQFADAAAQPDREMEIFFHPTRILMNDSAGIPLMADLAALRAAAVRNGGDPALVKPQIPADLVVDHSVMVDAYGSASAFDANLDLEFDRNGERYRFLRWAQGAFDNFRVVPPGTGICHQVNLEYLARGLWTTTDGNTTIAHPETLLGTDSHTPMINGIGVLGWGVGGVEGGTALLGQPVTMMVPRVVGCHLTGRLPAGTTATDLVITITERLRAHGVVGSFVEFHGAGLKALSLSDRATLANMAPEYGATMGFFPIDEEALRYLDVTARGGDHLALVEAYCRAQGLWHDPTEVQPDYAEIVEVDLGSIEPSIAGPRRPQDRIRLADAAARFGELAKGYGALPDGGAPVADQDWLLDHGHVVIASITSCTNTSNPSVMLAAGLLARNAVARGLTAKPWVKTSLAPGSRIVADYLSRMGLQASLDQLGFQLVGFGCMTCMGNSGPLDPAIAQAIDTHGVAASAVLSGNRNFEGRIHPHVRSNYICSPPLVVAYAIAGSLRVDLTREPLGTDPAGQPVYLRDIWPSAEELAEEVDRALDPDVFRERYGDVFTGDARWKAVKAPQSGTFEWDADSLYMKEPPFFEDFGPDLPPVTDIRGARVLAMFGDSITTDHISPVGTITPSSAAGQYLQELGVAPADFNSFAARRVNHEVMIRGAFANIRIRNEMADGREGGWTRDADSGEFVPIHVAAEGYRQAGVPLVVIAGKDYGVGSSRDWAAKGTTLLGIRAIIAEGFERIHRSNLIGFGVLPLQFMPGVTRQSLKLDGSEAFDIGGLAEGLEPRRHLPCRITRADGSVTDIELICRLDTAVELDYYRNGGSLHYVLRGAMGHA
ncbi:aconitate hydratase AcnA [Roseibacterium beibuensis]|uniref:Aconitate hydratase n=1 Tax=[Roseibacterium] beibuensis TaxID=1193142 RepID=A0ABP9KXE0_9RHOB|nr:aconitate hydratase AcnA [Roseibacterium beibuensis]MCS6622079.1 aconitate hydratase AcnA [Roseibacterium beibuensis]